MIYLSPVDGHREGTSLTTAVDPGRSDERVGISDDERRVRLRLPRDSAERTLAHARADETYERRGA
jgi:hypothetical protein